MTIFSPKEQFQKWHKEVAAQLRQEHQQGWFTISMDYALLLVSASGASEAEVHGAKRLIDAINNLAADKEEITKFPKQTLPSYEKSLEELAKTK